MEWQDDAIVDPPCANPNHPYGNPIFIHEHRSEDKDNSANCKNCRRALQICQPCKWKAECLCRALSVGIGEQIGVFGGTLPYVRKKMLRAEATKPC